MRVFQQKSLWHMLLLLTNCDLESIVFNLELHVANITFMWNCFTLNGGSGSAGTPKSEHLTTDEQSDDIRGRFQETIPENPREFER